VGEGEVRRSRGTCLVSVLEERVERPSLEEDLAVYLHIREQEYFSKIESGRSAPSIEVVLVPPERFHRRVDCILKAEGNWFGRNDRADLASPENARPPVGGDI
jgi:hypothetical protein